MLLKAKLLTEETHRSSMILKQAGGMFLPFMNSIQKCVLVFVTANLGLQIIQVF